MSEPPPLARRSVLGLLAAVAAAPAAAMPTPPDAALARILARVARQPDLAALGRLYRARHPGRAPGDWQRGLARDLPPGDEAVLVEALRARVRDDFRAGRIEALDGWRVSVTEARLCAAAHPA